MSTTSAPANQASKRRAEQIVDAVRSVVKMKTSSELDKLRHNARFLPYVLSPFVGVEWIMMVGMTISPQEEVMEGDVDDRGLSLEERCKIRKLHDKLVDALPGFREDLSYYKDNSDAFDNILNIIKEGARSGRSDSIGSAKKNVLFHVPQLDLGIEGHEHIKPNADKEDRGWHHLQTARQLCPVEMLVTFDQDPERFCRGVRGSEIEILAANFPLCLYDEAQYETSDMLKGFLTGGLVFRVGRILLTGPRSAMKQTPGGTGTGNPPLSKLYGERFHKMTPEALAYVACITRFSISDEPSWTGQDRAFKYEMLYNEILSLFDDRTDPWCQATLEHWNHWIFESARPTASVAASAHRNHAGLTTADRIRQQRETRRAAAAAAVLAE